MKDIFIYFKEFFLLLLSYFLFFIWSIRGLNIASAIIVLILIFADVVKYVDLAAYITLIALKENNIAIVPAVIKIVVAIMKNAKDVLFVANAAVALRKQMRMKLLDKNNINLFLYNILNILLFNKYINCIQENNII